MKKLLVMLILSTSAFAQSTLKCEIKSKYVGVYYNYCPIGSLAEAVDVRVSGGNFPMATTLVRCVKLEVECVQVTVGE